jgi:hypothetical protein
LRGALAFARVAFARVAFALAGFAREVFAREAAGFAPRPDAFAASAVVAAAAARTPPPRLSLRCPGRDLGRLPSTPGSSVLSAATREK